MLNIPRLQYAEKINIPISITRKPISRMWHKCYFEGIGYQLISKYRFYFSAIVGYHIPIQTQVLTLFIFFFAFFMRQKLKMIKILSLTFILCHSKINIFKKFFIVYYSKMFCHFEKVNVNLYSSNPTQLFKSNYFVSEWQQNKNLCILGRACGLKRLVIIIFLYMIISFKIINLIFILLFFKNRYYL